MPTFDGKSEKFELFEDLFQTSLKIHNQLTEEDKIYYFHSNMRGDALQTFKNITSPNRENLGEILTVFRRKYVKPQSMAMAKHKFQQLVFNPANQKLIDFSDELQKLAKDAFGVAAQAIIDQFIYAKMPPHLKKSINPAHLENGTYEQITAHLEKELELNNLEYPDETQMMFDVHIENWFIQIAKLTTAFLLARLLILKMSGSNKIWLEQKLAQTCFAESSTTNVGLVINLMIVH